ncbi:(2Fe-2S)-binding protein [Georgenia thermotolerans]|uniref:2Fe-2S iron-sulfur cluster binding domain-containing protein n=1 Tax=Georgenia thermotolerans TaxID=527326 RepID=A0A7J5UTQ4_9MICO|nr:(2Fe-2S)-binding protein [Georgenia thermotolerans]KAE8765669.1 2Fe-2S iron-sulfur cluster binding domain-containing protein [Georgenia thermotolerans]
MSTEMTIELSVNGITYSRQVPVRKLLSDVLREDLGMTGVHVGCEHGICGSCTVLVDGMPVRSCLTFAATLERSSIVTVEGLAADTGAEQMHPVQEAFDDQDAFQCGFCTPGFVLLIESGLLTHQAEEESVETRLAANICRCTGYTFIKQAMQQVSPCGSCDAGCGGR